ncbi:hypothetical protein [Streptomyces sp. NPDC008150]|uniref:hypothetical protein n=1 Tax=Streptomyces sp. NPDC008150 TaxID=3364816 RepID=UPI0036E956B7
MPNGFQPTYLANPFAAHPGERRLSGVDQGRLGMVAVAEAAVLRTARELDNLTREYNQALTRLNQARTALSLPSSPCKEQPDLDWVAAAEKEVQALQVVVSKKFTEQPQYVTLLGRVTSRHRLTDLTKVRGTFTLHPSGEQIEWVTSATFVDILDDLFEGAATVANAAQRPDGVWVFQGVAAATPQQWGTGADQVRFASLDGPAWFVIAARKDLRRALVREHGPACMQCHRAFSQHSLLSVAIDQDGDTALMCRSCKEDWRTAGRPAVRHLTAGEAAA